MSKFNLLVPTLLMLLAINASRAQENPGAPPPMPKPGAEHQMLKTWAGDFSYVLKYRMGPAAEAMEATGVHSAKMGVGGFFLFAVDKGKFAGMDFEGQMMTGYDTNKKKFVGTWIDNFGSYLTVMEGDWDAKTKILSMTADMFLPSMGKSEKVRLCTEVKDADHHFFKMYMPGPDGKEFCNMEIAYTRKK